MKTIALSIFLIFASSLSANETKSNNFKSTSESTVMEKTLQGSIQFDRSNRKNKKHRKATYGKKKGSKGTSCRKARKTMKKRGNW